MNTKCAFILVLLPSVLVAIEITKDSARNAADLVILGKVESVRRFQRSYSEGTGLLQAKLRILSQQKGPSLPPETITVVYEVPSPGQYISRCPPFAHLEVAQTAVFAIVITTNISPPSVTYFLPSACYVDMEVQKTTNANYGVHGSLDPLRVSAP
jgi:hypothetical protein